MRTCWKLNGLEKNSKKIHPNKKGVGYPQNHYEVDGFHPGCVLLLFPVDLGRSMFFEKDNISK